MMERQRIDQRAEAKALRALGDGGEVNAGRGGQPERRRVMLGGMIGVEAAAIVGLDDLQPFLVERVQGEVIAIEVAKIPNFIVPTDYTIFAESFRGRA